jgi:hypothetical protein
VSIFDSVMSDTVGVLWRAGTGTVDPWTKSEQQQDEAAALVQASTNPNDPTAVPSITPEQAADQAQHDITDTLTTFTLGGDDPMGADPSQAHLSLPSGQSLKDTANSLTNDNGTGCGITNLAGCVQIPSWVFWVGGGLAALVIVGYAVSTASKAKGLVS